MTAAPRRGRPGSPPPGSVQLQLPFGLVSQREAPPPRIRTPADLRRALGVPYTDEQLAAITAPLEPGVIVAGAGSGKTTVMAARVVWLVATGLVGPGEVLGLTFTNKAAAELRERVTAALANAGLLGPGEQPPDPFAQPADDGAEADAGEPTISTYHAYADRLIKEHGLRLGLEPSARLLADAGRYTLAARVVRTAAGPFEALRGSVSAITRDLIDLDAELSEHVADPAALRALDEEFTAAAAQFRDPVTGKSVKALNRKTGRTSQVYRDFLEAAAKAAQRAELTGLVEQYRALKAERELVDFGDQMSLGTRLAEEAPDVGRIEREKYRVVLLDEYQDTSVAQRRMLSALFSGPDEARGLGHPVTAVGDPCQSIYGWRGASAANIDQFPDHFPRLGKRRRNGKATPERAHVYPLTENRRSGERLLVFANEQSAHLRAHHASVRPLSPSAEKAGRGSAVVALLPTYTDEVRWLADRVQELDGSVPWSQVAVLVRKGAQIPEIYHELHARGVPVEVVGLSGLLDLPEVADLTAMLDVIDDPVANASLVRLLTGPRWRIGPRDLALLGRRARQLVEPPAATRPADSLSQALMGADPADVVSLCDALEDPGDDLPYSIEALHRFERFALEIRRLRRRLAEPVLDVLHAILQETGLDVEIAASPAAFRQRCQDTIGGFLAVAGRFADLDGEQSATAFRAFLRASAEHERGLDIDLPPTASDTVKILTMHKAKGLEWEVVVVPHQYDDPPKVESWIGRCSKLPHALRGDPMPMLDPLRDALAFEEFGDAMREHAALEESRLNYVTLTRAKSLLIASAHRWGPTQVRPRSPNAMLEALRDHCLDDPRNGRIMHWAPAPGEDEANPALAAGSETQWPLDLRGDARDRRREAAVAVMEAMRARSGSGSAGNSEPERGAGPQGKVAASQARGGRDRRDRAGGRAPVEAPPEYFASAQERALVESWDSDLDALLADLRRSRQTAREVPVPRSLSATRLLSFAADPEGFAEELFRPMPRPPAPQARRGTEFHAWVERRFGQTTLFDEEDLEQFDEEEAGGSHDLTELKEAFLSSPYAERQPYRVEAPFQLVLAPEGMTPITVRGRIDAVYRLADGSYEVVDWKTNRLPTADPLQLAIYRLAWAQLADVPLDRVAAAFLYVRSGEVRRYEDLPDRAGIEALLAQRGGAGRDLSGPAS